MAYVTDKDVELAKQGKLRLSNYVRQRLIDGMNEYHNRTMLQKIKDFFLLR